MKAKKIFPEIFIDTQKVINKDVVEYHIFLETHIRKFYKKNWYSRGKWYLQVIRHRYMYMGESKYVESIQQFTKEIYNNLLLSIVDPKHKAMFEIDSDQRTEKERIKSMRI